MRVGYNPVDDITSVSPDPISEWGNKMGGYGIQAAARGVETLAKTVPKSTDRVPSAPSPTATRTAAAGYQDYNPLSSVSAPSPVASPSYANPARAYPSRPAAAQVAGYDPLSSISRPPERPVTVADVPQLPGGASTVMKGVNPSMGDWTQTFLSREPSPYDSPAPQVAGYQNPARAFPSRPAAPQTRSTFTQSLLDKGFTGQGLASLGTPSPVSTPAPHIAPRSPNPAAQRAWNIQRARETAPPAVADTSIYGDAQDKPAYQKMADALTGYADRKTAPIKSGGDWANGLLGGTSQNNPNWQAPGNPNARDQLNNLAEKVGTTKTKATAEQIKQAVEDGKADPEYKTLSQEKKQLIAKYVREGMTYAEAKAKALGGTTGGGTGTGTGGTVTRPAVYYPQYYSTWAGLPSGQRYG